MREGSDGAFLAGDAGEVIADCLRDPLLTRCRASSPPDVVGVPLDLLLPFDLKQSLYLLFLEHLAIAATS